MSDWKSVQRKEHFKLNVRFSIADSINEFEQQLDYKLSFIIDQKSKKGNSNNARNVYGNDTTDVPA